MATVRLDQIVVRDRVRQELGDVTELAASIARFGLLAPLVVRMDGSDPVLVAGERRLAALLLNGATEAEAKVVADLDDYLAAQVESDENTHRKDFTPSERVAMGRRLMELEKAAAAARQTSGQVAPTSEKGRAGDKVAEAVGTSRRNYEKAEKVVEAAEAGDPDAIAARGRMDATGKVDPAYRDVTDPVIDEDEQARLAIILVAFDDPAVHERFTARFGPLDKLRQSKRDAVQAWLTAAADEINEAASAAGPDAAEVVDPPPASAAPDLEMVLAEHEDEVEPVGDEVDDDEPVEYDDTAAGVRSEGKRPAPEGTPARVYIERSRSVMAAARAILDVDPAEFDLVLGALAKTNDADTLDELRTVVTLLEERVARFRLMFGPAPKGEA